MKESTLLKIKFIHWIENLSDEQIDNLILDTQNCGELDRCFSYCLDADCDYHALLLLVRTPTTDFRKRVVEWINHTDEQKLRDLLERGVVCGEQSFCMNYCGSIDCSFKRFIVDLCEICEFRV